MKYKKGKRKRLDLVEIGSRKIVMNVGYYIKGEDAES